jgi:hypothetical protein
MPDAAEPRALMHGANDQGGATSSTSRSDPLRATTSAPGLRRWLATMTDHGLAGMTERARLNAAVRAPPQDRDWDRRSTKAQSVSTGQVGTVIENQRCPVCEVDRMWQNPNRIHTTHPHPRRQTRRGSTFAGLCESLTKARAVLSRRQGRIKVSTWLPTVGIR